MTYTYLMSLPSYSGSLGRMGVAYAKTCLVWGRDHVWRGGCSVSRTTQSGWLLDPLDQFRKSSRRCPSPSASNVRDTGRRLQGCSARSRHRQRHEPDARRRNHAPKEDATACSELRKHLDHPGRTSTHCSRKHAVTRATSSRSVSPFQGGLGDLDVVKAVRARDDGAVEPYAVRNRSVDEGPNHPPRPM